MSQNSLFLTRTCVPPGRGRHAHTATPQIGQNSFFCVWRTGPSFCAKSEELWLNSFKLFFGLWNKEGLEIKSEADSSDGESPAENTPTKTSISPGHFSAKVKWSYALFVLDDEA
jgi:hypothetical protein